MGAGEDLDVAAGHLEVLALAMDLEGWAAEIDAVAGERDD